MISYAQNFEDVMLWRALKNIKNGFYVDVGAWSPDIDSVTKVFYENGWSGINIEPNPDFYNLYIKYRSNDINLRVAISDEISESDMFFSTNPGLSSLDEEIANSHKKFGFSTKKHKVSVTTLKEVFSRYCKKDIHFLKIDIEGYEKRALLGNDWTCFRPWIVVVEATLPMTQIENYEVWEYILLEANYTFAYADGLNRFYVANEHSELVKSFKYPPNVFDEFIRCEHYNANILASDLKNKNDELNNELSKVEAENNNLKDELSKLNENNVKLSSELQKNIEEYKKLQDLYNSIINSNSWKIMKPFRKLRKFLGEVI